MCQQFQYLLASDSARYGGPNIRRWLLKVELLLLLYIIDMLLENLLKIR